MAEQEKSLVKSSHPLTRFDPKAQKELVVRGLNALSEVKDADFYFFKGEEHRMRGEEKLAISYYEKALQIDSEHEDSLFWMGWCYSSEVRDRTVDDIEFDNTIRNEISAAAFQKLIAIREKKDSVGWGNYVVYYNLGVAQDSLGLYEAAVESYERAIELNPDDADAHCNLGSVYLNLCRYQEAIESSKQAIRIKPDDAETHYNLGLAYYKLGRYQEAIEAYKQSIRINPDDADAHYNLGCTYSITGDKGSALDECKILKTLDAEKANELFNLIYQ